jgi:hypothetical protein
MYIEAGQGQVVPHITEINYCYGPDNPGFNFSGTLLSNCTQICTDSNLLFAASETLQSCTQLVGNYTEESGEKILNSTTFNNTFRRTASLINECMRQYCLFPDPNLGAIINKVL